MPGTAPPPPPPGRWLLLLQRGLLRGTAGERTWQASLGREERMHAGGEERGQGEARHSHVDSGGRAIPKQQVARWEVGDSKLAHHVTLCVQDPAHCYALVLGQIQSHLQRQTDMSGVGASHWAEGALGRHHPDSTPFRERTSVLSESPATNHLYPTGDKSHTLPRTRALELCTPHTLNSLGQRNLI